MSEFLLFIRQFLSGLRLWATVHPWEEGLRVRLGKHVTRLHPGVHVLVPLIDTFYVQTIRLRISTLGRQMVACSDRKTVTFSASVGYAICDVKKLYESLHHAEDTIVNLVRSAIAKVISDQESDKLTLRHIEDQIVHSGAVAMLNSYGLTSITVQLTEFAVVRTYRLVGDYGYGSHGESLDVNNQGRR